MFSQWVSGELEIIRGDLKDPLLISKCSTLFTAYCEILKNNGISIILSIKRCLVPISKSCMQKQ